MGSVGNPGLELSLKAAELGRCDSPLVSALCLLEVSREGQKAKRKWIFFLGHKKRIRGEKGKLETEVRAPRIHVTQKRSIN